MIPTIEDIFHMLSEGRLSFDEAEDYVREHIRLAANNEVELLVSAEHAALHAKRAYQQADAMLEARKL
jgi:hypothetical protein